jgi:superfamily II DNA or RNA helicase
MLKLREYQERGIIGVSLKLREYDKVVFQLATGGGKTVVMAALCNLILKKGAGPVMILVHRQELMDQTIKTIFKWYDIMAFPIVSGKRVQLGHQIYVGMVETVARLPKERLPKVKYLMMDEVHLGNFKKIHEKFEGVKMIGFTATPLLATKKEALKDYFNDIVCAIDTPDLISLNLSEQSQGLVQNRTYYIKGSVNRNELASNKFGTDFDEKAMGDEFSKGKNVMNALHAYQQYGEGKKAVIFNCNINHSILVNQVFKDASIPSRHLDASQGGITEDGRILDTEAWRKDCIRWLRNTPGAVLHNVGILTVGFDEPSVEVIVVNRATMSLTLWLQMTGRGSRPWVSVGADGVLYTKEQFTIIDLGGNAVTHGDWCTARDWANIFHNPPRPGAPGIAPVKECPSCESIVPASAAICKFCRYQFEIKPIKYDSIKLELVLFTKSIKAAELEEEKKLRGYKDYWPLFQMRNEIIKKAKLNLGETPLDTELYSNLLALFNDKAKEWYNLRSEKFTEGKRKFTKEVFQAEIVKHFKPWDN